MILEDYGWDSWFDSKYKSLNMHLKTGRVVGNSEIYKVACEDGVIDAGISGRLIYSTASDKELPVPGDWVLIISDDSLSGYSIYDLLPRRSLLEVPDEDNPEERIPAAANVDYILAAFPFVDGIDLSIFEKIIDISRDWGAEPIFLIYGMSADNKGKENLKKSAGDAGIIFIDSIDISGLAELNSVLTPRKTYAVTGVNIDDVSTIISFLTDGEVFYKSILGNDAVNHDLNKDVLHVLPSSAILLNIPLTGDMGFFNGNNGVDKVNDSGDSGAIQEIAGFCRFSDCRHVNEPGCAILQALDNGEIDYDDYRVFIKALKKEAVKVSAAEQAEVKKQKKSAFIKGDKIIGP